MRDDERTSGSKLTRRRAVIVGAAGLATTSAFVAARGTEHDERRSAMTTRLPAIYIPHGGGPFSHVDFGIPKAEVEPLAAYWRSIGAMSPRPRALLVVSAHWEQDVPTVMTSAAPPMLYDYSGFPEAAYALQWPAPGDAALASRVQALLADADIASGTDDARGFDHGTFVPMLCSFPDADVPCVQLSLVRGLDVQSHIAIGAALAPLRDEGVLIVGSGMSYHNMRGFRDRGADEAALAFDAWLQDAMGESAERRAVALQKWTSAPYAKDVHPREEHLAPLFVIAGTASETNDPARFPFSGPVMGKRVSAVQFG